MYAFWRSVCPLLAKPFTVTEILIRGAQTFVCHCICKNFHQIDAKNVKNPVLTKSSPCLRCPNVNTDIYGELHQNHQHQQYERISHGKHVSIVLCYMAFYCPALVLHWHYFQFKHLKLNPLAFKHNINMMHVIHQFYLFYPQNGQTVMTPF